QVIVHRKSDALQSPSANTVEPPSATMFGSVGCTATARSYQDWSLSASPNSCLGTRSTTRVLRPSMRQRRGVPPSAYRIDGSEGATARPIRSSLRIPFSGTGSNGPAAPFSETYSAVPRVPPGATLGFTSATHSRDGVAPSAGVHTTSVVNGPS